MRLFFGVALTGAALEAARRAQDELRRAARLSFANRDQLHLTLAFLGETSPAAVTLAREAGRAAAERTRSFSMALGAAGAFPDARRPRVVWVGADQGAAELAALAATLRAELQARAVPFDEKPFRAHATLARARPAQVREAAEALAKVPPHPGAQAVNGFTLFESVGGIHRAVEAFALHGID